MNDFAGLLTPPPPADNMPEQLAFIEMIMNENLERERSFDGGDVNLNTMFTFEEVEKAVGRPKLGKAPGLDGILNECFKNNATINILTTTLFNVSMDTHMVPSIWKKGIIAPIPKGKDNNPHIPLNDWGISLLLTASKLFTASISHPISHFLECNNKLCNEQNGFRPEHSTLGHIFTLHDICKVKISLRQDTFFSSIDFQKAFDYINPNLILHNLSFISITGNIYHIIKSVYTNPKSCVQLNSQLTHWSPASSGVRQGDSLSPILFAIYINMCDMVKQEGAGVYIGSHRLYMPLYADDIVMLAPTAEKAQKQLNILSAWCKKWLM